MNYCKRMFCLLISLVTLINFSLYAEKTLPVDISFWFNNDGIASEKNMQSANFDGGGYSYALEQMPKPTSIFVVKGIKYIFPSCNDRQNNNIICKGEIIKLPAQQVQTIYLLGACVNGNYKENFRLIYTDGTEEILKIGFSDWCASLPQYNEEQGVKSAFRYTGQAKDLVACNLWVQSVKLSYPEKKVAQINLTANPNMHIFGITLGGEQLNIKADDKIISDNVEKIKINNNIWDLKDIFNNTGIVNNDNIKNGNFDGGGYSFPGEEMKYGIKTINNVNLELCSSTEKNDNIKCNNQTLVLIKPEKGKSLVILGAAEYGNFKDKLKIIYSDKETVDSDFGLSDWCSEKAEYGEIPGLQAGYRYSPTGSEKVATKIWLVKIPLADKMVSSIVLPSNNHMHIFSISLEK